MSNIGHDQEISRNTLGNHKFFDFKMGVLGAAVMGAAVYWINSEYGFDAASIAATKQTAYTFLVGGVVTRMCENLATKFRNGTLSKTAAVIIPSGLTIGLNYLLHSLKGTPEPFESTIPTMIGAPLGTFWWARRKRNQLERFVENISD